MTALQKVLERISGLDLNKPYFWTLRIDEDEYVSLREYVKAELERDKGIAIRTNSLRIMAYIAEWYKREYDGANSPVEMKLDSTDLSQLWKSSGIDIDRFVASDNGSHRWLYSIYVLGGLAARYEMNRADDGRFLRKLCRLFHGEDIEISVGDQNALAFRKSISEKQSLFGYLREIFNGKMPVAESDMSAGSLFAGFRDMIVNANIRSLTKTDKFQISMGLSIITESEMARRVLSIRMRPEEVGAGCHCYIRYDRMLAWGFKDPDVILWLKMSLRFLYHGELVKDTDFSKPARQWNHTGWRDSGMLCRGEAVFHYNDVPCSRFDMVEFVMLASTGEEQTIGKWSYAGYAEFHLSDPRSCFWTSKSGGRAKSTGVMFDDVWSPVPSIRLERFVLIDADDHVSESHVNWIRVEAPFALTNGVITTETFYPKEGIQKLALKRYTNLIEYNPEGTFRVTAAGNEEYQLSVIFYRNDVMVSITDENGDRFVFPDMVEFMEGGQYYAWTEERKPKGGIVRLRVAIGDRKFMASVVLLTPLDSVHPTVRDLDTRRLLYRSGGEIKIEEDKLFFSDRPMKVSETCLITEGKVNVYLPLLRPLTFRQWIMDGRSAGAIDEIFLLPWILRDRVRLVSLTSEGIEEYDCSRLKHWDASDRNFPYLWTEGKSIPATQSDADAPEWLMLILGDKPPRKATDYIFWDMKTGSVPYERFLPYNFSETGIGFKNPDSISSPEYPYPYLHEDSFDWGDDDGWGDEQGEKEDIPSSSEIEAFLVACKYRSYFFIFPQLIDIEQKELKDKLLEPLRQHDGGRISEIHLKGLERLTQETNIKIDLNELRK